MKHADALRYVGARTRATDVQASFVRSHVPTKVTLVSYYTRCAILDNLEQSGLIKCLESYTPPTSLCVLMRSTDSDNDLYFDFGHSQAIEQQIITEYQAMQLTRTPDCLYNFVISYLSAHQKAIFSRGRILLSYCAWPVPNGFKKRTIFASPKGYLYDWEKLPFDWPASAQIWNFSLGNWMDRQHPYALFWNSSFVICAIDTADAIAKSASIIAEAHKQGVDLEIDQPESWVESIDDIDLRTGWTGIYPAGYRKERNSTEF